MTLVRVLDGRIAEALAYAKTPVVADLGQANQQTTSEVIRRYNDAFQQHDPSALRELIAEDCVIENSNPAPNGSRHVGREACFDLWQRIATTPGIQFDIEDVEVIGERATIRWRLRWGEGESKSVRGVNLMRVRRGPDRGSPRLRQGRMSARTNFDAETTGVSDMSTQKSSSPDGTPSIPAREMKWSKNSKTWCFELEAPLGCLDMAITADPVDSNRINIFEFWRSEKDLNSWRAGPMLRRRLLASFASKCRNTPSSQCAETRPHVDEHAARSSSRSAGTRSAEGSGRDQAAVGRNDRLS